MKEMKKIMANQNNYENLSHSRQEQFMRKQDFNENQGNYLLQQLINI